MKKSVPTRERNKDFVPELAVKRWGKGTFFIPFPALAP
jgi:hypothetical protein